MTAPFRLLAVSDRTSLGEDSLPAWFRQLAEAGVDALQVREKDLGDRALWALAGPARAASLPPSRKRAQTPGASRTGP